ncbi:MAG: arginine--tRNA ligase [Gemmataceae bacterium]
MNLLHLLQDAFGRALVGLAADPGKYRSLVKAAQDSKHGDYQANIAMPLGKELGKPPRAVAEELVRRLQLGDLLEPPEIAGPGFINLRIRLEWKGRMLRCAAKNDRLDVSSSLKPRTYVIDYSSPNVAKPLHVGHLRSTIIGDALTRTLRHLGHKVIADNHLGDWGTQFGILIYGYKNFRDDAAYRADPVRELNRLYLHVRELTKGAEEEEDRRADPVAKQHADACRAETAKLHHGDAENVALWKQFMPACMAEIEQIYRRLGVKFDYQHGESFYNQYLPAVVQDLLDKKVARESDGAVGIFKEADAEAPPSLIRKRDGAFTYTTTDLATIRYRLDQFHPQAMLYVVDARQALHFQNLFAAARRWGYSDVELTHISFGSVLGADRRPLKTRDGGAVELGSLLDEAVTRARQAYDETRAERSGRGSEVPELTEVEKQRVAEIVGLGAVKYADLSQHRTTDYVFSWDKMLAMEGNTAAYMQYAFARCRSIFRKAEEVPELVRFDPPLPQLANPFERTLALQLLRFEETLQASATEYLPHLITSYLWDLAKSYSGFFQNCPVIEAETTDLRNQRLLLCDLTARTIKQALELLGIEVIERM